MIIASYHKDDSPTTHTRTHTHTQKKKEKKRGRGGGRRPAPPTHHFFPDVTGHTRINEQSTTNLTPINRCGPQTPPTHLQARPPETRPPPKHNLCCSTHIRDLLQPNSSFPEISHLSKSAQDTNANNPQIMESRLQISPKTGSYNPLAKPPHAHPITKKKGIKQRFLGNLYLTHIVASRTPDSYGVIRDNLRMRSLGENNKNTKQHIFTYLHVQGRSENLGTHLRGNRSVPRPAFTDTTPSSVHKNDLVAPKDKGENHHQPRETKSTLPQQ